MNICSGPKKTLVVIESTQEYSEEAIISTCRHLLRRGQTLALYCGDSVYIPIDTENELAFCCRIIVNKHNACIDPSDAQYEEEGDEDQDSDSGSTYSDDPPSISLLVHEFKKLGPACNRQVLSGLKIVKD
jgi:hypothetical protein